MNLNRVIVHAIFKNVGIKATEKLSTNLLPNDSKTFSLIEKLDFNYSQKSIKHANFAITQPLKLFLAEFKKYLKTMDDQCFIDFTRTVTTKLKNDITNDDRSKGGYLVFADYKKESTHFLSIFLIRESKSVSFQIDKKNSSFVIDEIDHIDLDKFAMACRINKTIFSTNTSKHCLSFIQNKLSDISNYFINWIGVDESKWESDKLYTEELYKITAIIQRPTDDNGNEISIDDYRKKVFEIVKAQKNQVDLKILGKAFYDNEHFISDYAIKNGIIIDTEFKADKRTLDRFIHYIASADGITLKFPPETFNEKVSFESSDKVIITSESLVKKLKEVMDFNE